jgi:hypothetical protein
MKPKKSFSVILRVGGESRKTLKTLDPPVKPGDDGCVVGSPGSAFPSSVAGYCGGRAPLRQAQGYGRAGKSGDDDIMTLIIFRKDLFIMAIYKE